jgi:hypothetical protein
VARVNGSGRERRECGSAEVTEVMDSGGDNASSANESALLANVEALIADCGAAIPDATAEDLERDWIELGPRVWVDAACYPASCPHRSHRRTYWVTPGGQLACGVCTTAPRKSRPPERLPGFWSSMQTWS